jgi:hypothetical protein
VANKRRTLAADRQAGLLTVPAEALRFDAIPCQFAAAAKDSGGNRPISMLARTAQPIEHWYFGKVVHDMAGMQLAAPTLPIDYCHDPEEVLGYLDEFKADNEGLTVAGDLVTFQPDDRTAEICHKSDNGVPYQASIAFDPNTFVLESVPAGMQANVNGYALEGPAVVVRKWTLVAVSVCPYGADSGTRASFTAADGAADVSIDFVLQEKTEMSATPAPAATTPANTPATTPAAATPATATQQTAATPATQADPRAEFKATLAKFAAKFGAENGTKWAAEGLTYEAALEKHSEALATQLTAATGKTTELQTKLAAIPRGEEKPASFATNETHPAGGGTAAATPTQFAHLGNVGKFAASINLPK